MNRRYLPFAVVLAVVAVGVALLTIPRTTASAPTASAPRLEGTVFPPKPAADFRLTDQFGRTVSITQFRGRTVILTFMGAHCTELCPLVAEKIRQSVDQLGAAGSKIAIVAISTDPGGDTRSAVIAFSRAHKLLHRWFYLTGSQARLQPVWRAYYIYVAPPNSPPAIRDSHTSATYLIDKNGNRRVLMAGALNSNLLKRDLLILSGRSLGLARTVGKPVPEVGHAAPDFALKTPSGATIRLSSLRGKTVLVNFWATWCIACRTEAPFLASVYDRLHGQGLVVLGVDQQEGPSDIDSFARRYHLTYPLALDTDAGVDGAYNVSVLPTSFLVNPGGVITAITYGAVDSQFVSGHIVPLLKGQNGA